MKRDVGNAEGWQNVTPVHQLSQMGSAAPIHRPTGLYGGPGAIPATWVGLEGKWARWNSPLHPGIRRVRPSRPGPGIYKGNSSGTSSTLISITSRVKGTPIFRKSAKR